MSDSGEGRWTIKAAIDEAVPAPVLTTALYERFASRGEADFADKLLSAMRYEFGGQWKNRPREQVNAARGEIDEHAVTSDALVSSAPPAIWPQKIFPALQA